MERDACFLLTLVLKKKEKFPYVLAFFFFLSCCLCSCKLTTLQLGVINGAPQRFGGLEVSLLTGCTLCEKGENGPVPQSGQNPLSVDVDIMCVSNDAQMAKAKCRRWSFHAVFVVVGFFFPFFLLPT